MTRKEYVEEYKEIGTKMFGHCVIPTIYDFANAFVNNNEEAMNKITRLTDYTGNTDDIIKSVNRRNDNYSEAESNKFMDSVIAANVTDITESGYFYKKLVSSCDDMSIDIDDCGSDGIEITLPVDKDTFDYKIKNRWVMELNKYIEDFTELPESGIIHIRTFLSCKHGNRHFCKKCAGLFRRSATSSFTPKNIGIYATYMITEHATQASLDSMNKGTKDKLNVLLEKPIENINNMSGAISKINEFIDTIGHIGVEARFYEVALLSRWRNNRFMSLKTSFLYQDDLLGAFIYKPNTVTFNKLISSGTFEANSTKTKIAFDRYDEGDI